MGASPDDLDRLPKMSPCEEFVAPPMPDRLARRRRRMRFTLRGMMIAVAAIAAALAAIVPSGTPQPVKATSSDPKLATRQEKILHGVLWGLSYPQACEIAEREGRPVLIYFSSINDANARMIEHGMMPRADVVPWLSRFVAVELYMDYCPITSLTPTQREKIGEENTAFMLDLTGEAFEPQFAVTDAHGHLIAARAGLYEPGEFIDFLETAEASHRSRMGTARFRIGSVWAVGSVLIAAICLIGILNRTRLGREKKPGRRSHSHQPREPIG
jgi:hypothetical protein